MNPSAEHKSKKDNKDHKDSLQNHKRHKGDREEHGDYDYIESKKDEKDKKERKGDRIDYQFNTPSTPPQNRSKQISLRPDLSPDLNLDGFREMSYESWIDNCKKITPCPPMAFYLLPQRNTDPNSVEKYHEKATPLMIVAPSAIFQEYFTEFGQMEKLNEALTQGYVMEETGPFFERKIIIICSNQLADYIYYLIDPKP